MKRLLSILLLILPILPCRGQEEIYIDVQPNSVIYQVPSKLRIPKDKRLQYDYSGAKKKKVRKGGHYRVTGLSNFNRAPGYDTYLAEEKGKQYFIPKNIVRDNAFIDGINREISDASLRLSDSVEFCKNAHQAAYDSLLAAVENGSVQCWNRIMGIRHNPDSILDVHIRELMDADVLHYRQIRERHQEWVETLPIGSRYAAGLLAITNTSLEKGASGACDYLLEFTNLSSKTIQTLTWTGKLLDRAGNELTCTVRNRPTFSGHFRGPCPPAWPAATRWKNIAYHPEAERIALSSISITYADGSRYDIDGDVLQTLLSMPSEALPAGVHTASHLEGLNRFEIDHNQLLQQKKKLFRLNLPDEEALERQNLEHWSELKTAVTRKGTMDKSMGEILSDERFQPLLERGTLKLSIQTYLETAEASERQARRYQRFRTENYYE